MDNTTLHVPDDLLTKTQHGYCTEVSCLTPFGSLSKAIAVDTKILEFVHEDVFFYSHTNCNSDGETTDWVFYNAEGDVLKIFND